MKTIKLALAALVLTAVAAEPILAGTNYNSSRSNRGKLTYIDPPAESPGEQFFVEANLARINGRFSLDGANNSGELVFPGIMPGRYQLTIRARPGRYTLDGVNVVADGLECDWTEDQFNVSCALRLRGEEPQDITIELLSFFDGETREDGVADAETGREAEADVSPIAAEGYNSGRSQRGMVNNRIRLANPDAGTADSSDDVAEGEYIDLTGDEFDVAPSADACLTPDTNGRVFYAPFDTSFGPDLVSNTPTTGTQPGPNRYLVPASLPDHTGNVLHLSAVPREERNNFSGRVRFLRDGMSGRSPFAFQTDDFTVTFWMRTFNDHARLIGTRQRTSDAGNSQRGIMVNLEGGRIEFQMNLGEAAQSQGTWFQNWSAGQVLSNGTWHMLSVSIDRDHEDGGLLFVDGVQISHFDPRAFAASLGERNYLGIGFDGVTQGNDGDFEIDEIEIYHRALTPEEIAARYAMPLCK